MQLMRLQWHCWSAYGESVMFVALSAAPSALMPYVGDSQGETRGRPKDGVRRLPLFWLLISRPSEMISARDGVMTRRRRGRARVTVVVVRVVPSVVMPVVTFSRSW